MHFIRYSSTLQNHLKTIAIAKKRRPTGSTNNNCKKRRKIKPGICVNIPNEPRLPGK
jgi:hypothetical protein